jgi:ethanolamine utilization cobalamin adenosyltransferase
MASTMMQSYDLDSHANERTHPHLDSRAKIRGLVASILWRQLELTRPRRAIDRALQEFWPAPPNP